MQHVWSSSGGDIQDTGYQVSIHMRVPYRMVRKVVGPRAHSAEFIDVMQSRDRELVFKVTGTCDGSREIVL